MKKQLRVFHISGVGKMFVEGMVEGTIIRVTDSDVLLATNRNRILATNWDRVLKEHIVPRYVVQRKAKPTDPRWFADFLLIMLLKPSHVASAIGDLREHFDKLHFTAKVDRPGGAGTGRRFWAEDESSWMEAYDRPNMASESTLWIDLGGG